MNCRFPFLPVAVLALGLNYSAAAPAAAPATDSASPLPKMEVVKDGPEAGLRQGMTAAAVTAIMGKPASVKPMVAPTGTAETWAYRTLIDTREKQVPVITEAVTIRVKDANGSEIVQQVTPASTTFKVERVRTFRNTSLLMFNGALLNQKSSLEQLRDYY